MRFLIDFVNVLPTFTRTFSTRYGLPARLQLRRFHPDDANRYFLFLRDSNLRALRNIFTGAKFIGTAPIYTNEKVAWKFMRYPGPWLLGSGEARRGPRARPPPSTWPRRPTTTWPSCDAASWPTTPCARASRRPGSWAGPTVSCWRPTSSWSGSGAGGSFVAAELAAKTTQRVLILEKGDFIEPTEFLQRERLMMPRIFDTEFSVLQIFGREIPTVSTAVVTGKLVGGSATINHALAFEPPRPVIRDWHDRLGADVRLRRPRPPPGGDPNAAAHRVRCPTRRSPAATSPCAGASRRWACPTTARPCATPISASAAATATWAAATTASSPR